MAPDESLWNPQIKEPEQCKLCLMYFHQDICGVCNSCYKSYKRWEYNQPSYFGQKSQKNDVLHIDEDVTECEEE